MTSTHSRPSLQRGLASCSLPCNWIPIICQIAQSQAPSSNAWRNVGSCCKGMLFGCQHPAASIQTINRPAQPSQLSSETLGMRCSHGQANKYTQSQLVSMKTQDIGHIRQQSQAEAKVGSTQPNDYTHEIHLISALGVSQSSSTGKNMHFPQTG